MFQLYEYDDLDDSGHIEPKFPQREVRLNSMVWHLNESKLTDKEAMVHVYGVVDDNRHGKHGIVNIMVSIFFFLYIFL